MRTRLTWWPGVLVARILVAFSLDDDKAPDTHFSLSGPSSARVSRQTYVGLNNRIRLLHHSKRWLVRTR